MSIEELKAKKKKKISICCRGKKRKKGNTKNIILWILIKMSDFVMYNQSEIHTAERRVHGKWWIRKNKKK